MERIIFTSSEKAANPTSVMGTSKLMGERLMTAANSDSRAGETVFPSTRFGNVLGSRGSAIPIFREQIKRGGTITLSDPKMICGKETQAKAATQQNDFGLMVAVNYNDWSMA